MPLYTEWWCTAPVLNPAPGNGNDPLCLCIQSGGALRKSCVKSISCSSNDPSLCLCIQSGGVHCSCVKSSSCNGNVLLCLCIQSGGAEQRCSCVKSSSCNGNDLLCLCLLQPARQQRQGQWMRNSSSSPLRMFPRSRSVSTWFAVFFWHQALCVSASSLQCYLTVDRVLLHKMLISRNWCAFHKLGDFAVATHNLMWILLLSYLAFGCACKSHLFKLSYWLSVCVYVCVCVCVCVRARACSWLFWLGFSALLCNGLCAPIWRNNTKEYIISMIIITVALGFQ